MHINVSKDDLWDLRELTRDVIWRTENSPNPAAHGRRAEVTRKFYKKLAQAEVKAFGHDWNADKKFFPKK